jgi:uncharacterized protein (TIGR02646 family)
MRYVVRQPAPQALNRLKDGKTELERARSYFVGTSKKRGFDFDIYRDAEVKQALRSNFDGKCAYCEATYDATQTEDVEHYRPKGRIDNGKTKLQPGYWWLASDWENLLPSCILCNRENNLLLFDGNLLKMGKGDRFPIEDEAKRARKEGQHSGEVPLLINPCVDDPANYLRFEERDGRCIIVPKSIDPASLSYRRARESIDTYGLNRQSLVKDRTRNMILIQASLRSLERNVIALNTASASEMPRIELDIEDEKLSLALQLDSEARYTAMAQWLIYPVLGRLGVAL